MKTYHLFLTILFSCMTSMAFSAERPDVIRHDAQYLERAVAIHVEWQSVNPVTKVNVSAGREVKEITVDEYDNRRNTSGYQGEVSVNISVDPNLFQQGVPYVIQLEDDLRQKSNVVTGKAPIQALQLPGHAPLQQQDDNWGKSHLSAMPTQQQQPGVVEIVDKVVGLYDRFDTAPSLDVIKVNVLSPENVSFSARGNDDKSLQEIRIKVFNNIGAMIGFQSISGIGKVWQGTSQTFNLGGGTFRVVIQATDNVGNTSKEQSATFQLSGQTKELVTAQETPPIAPTIQPAQQNGQPQTSGSAPQAVSTEQQQPQQMNIQQNNVQTEPQAVVPDNNTQTPPVQIIPGL